MPNQFIITLSLNLHFYNSLNNLNYSADKPATEQTSSTNTANNIPQAGIPGMGNLGGFPGLSGLGGIGGMGGMGGMSGMPNVDPNQLNDMMSNPMYANMMSQVNFIFKK